jgi:hypothetical protein
VVAVAFVLASGYQGTPGQMLRAFAALAALSVALIAGMAAVERWSGRTGVRR